MQRSLPFVCALALAAAAACTPATRFEGSSKFPDGVTGCRHACATEGLELGAFVMSGEFATSCVCQPKPTGATASADAAMLVRTQTFEVVETNVLDRQNARSHEQLLPH
jgi:hypothetical protein